MAEHYQFNGGAFAPVEQVDVTTEQEKVNNQIQSSEERYFDALRTNDARRLQDTQDFWKAVGKFSNSAKAYSEELYNKKKEEEMAEGAMLAVTGDYNFESIQALIDQEDAMRREHTHLSRLGGDITNETGSFILGQELRDLSGWGRYSFVKELLIKEAKQYSSFLLENKENVFITVTGEDGTDITVGYGNQFDREPQSIEESDALNAKMKQMFVGRFAGVNPTLLQLAVKPVLDRADEAERTERISQLETNAEQLEQNRQTSILLTSLESNSWDGREAIEEWVNNNMWRYGNNLGLTRSALADMLEDAVKEGKLNSYNAIAAIQELIPHGGFDPENPQDMLIYPEWEDLESRIMDANQIFRQGLEEKQEAQMKADIDAFLASVENPTDQDRIALVRGLRERYPNLPIPETYYEELMGWEDDDAARQRLDRILGDTGYLTELDFVNVNPALKSEYIEGGNVRLSGYEPISFVAELGKPQTDYVESVVKSALNESLAITDLASPRGLRALEYTNNEFVRWYNEALNANNSPENALKLARQQLEQSIKDPAFLREAVRETSAQDEFLRAETMASAKAEVKPTSGGYKTTILPALEDDIDLLEAWAESGGELPVPSYYAQLAWNNGLFPQELANAQAILHGFKSNNFDIEARKNELPAHILRLLIYKPTPERVQQAELELEDFNNEDNEDHISVWLQPANLRTFSV